MLKTIDILKLENEEPNLKTAEVIFNLGQLFKK
jgi:hypothetical protein